MLRIYYGFIAIFLFCLPALGQRDIDGDAFMAFQDICIRDTEQFEHAKWSAGDMITAPELLRSQLLRGRDGEIWISSVHPLVAVSVLKDGGCNIEMKPVREDYLAGFLKAIPGQDIFDHQEIGSSWSTWYVIKTQKNQGVLMAALLDLNGERSANLSYVSIKDILADQRLADFLSLDQVEFQKLKNKLIQK